MLFQDAILEFGFDCKVRKLSPKSITNYQKQLRYLQNYLEQEYRIKSVEQVRTAHIKMFLDSMNMSIPVKALTSYTSHRQQKNSWLAAIAGLALIGAFLENLIEGIGDAILILAIRVVAVNEVIQTAGTKFTNFIGTHLLFLLYADTGSSVMLVGSAAASWRATACSSGASIPNCLISGNCSRNQFLMTG